MVGLMVTSKRAYSKGHLPRRCCQCPRPCGEPLLTHTSTGDPPTLAGRSGSVSCGGHCSFPRVLLCIRFCLCPPRVESVSPSPVEVLQSNPVGLQSLLPWGFPVPLPEPRAGKPDVGAQNFHNSGRTSLVLSFSSL